MSARFLLRTVWLTLGVLAWSAPTFVTGYHSSGRSLGTHNRYRLSRLFAIESRLDQKSQIRRKRLITLENPKAMDDMHEKYKIFHSYMTSFVNELPSKLKPGAPPELEYAKIIPDILRPDDPDFDPFNKDKIEEKAGIVIKFMELLLSEVGQYVADNNQDWFSEQSGILNVWIGLVKFTLVSVSISDEPPTVEYLEAGIGGINTRFNTYVPINVDHLQKLLNVLTNRNGR